MNLLAPNTRDELTTAETLRLLSVMAARLHDAAEQAEHDIEGDDSDDGS